MKFFIFFFCFFSLIIFSNELSVEEKNNLDGIYGDAGHIGAEFALGIQNFEYLKVREKAYFNYFYKNSITKVRFKTAVSYFSTDFNRVNFLMESNIVSDGRKFSYDSFSFAVIDKIYVNEDWSTDFGMTTVFKGNYRFLINFGLTYYFIKTKSYYWMISSYFNLLLNSISLSNNFYLSWIYVFQ